MSNISKLKWHCRRGVKELDIVLERYLDQHYTNADPFEKTAFKELLALEDPTLLAMLMGDMVATNPAQKKVLEKFRSW